MAEEWLEVPLTYDKFAIISPEDADLLQYMWYAWKGSNARYYAQRSMKHPDGIHRNTPMHRVILSRMLGRDLRPDEVVDHIDLDGLNNCRSNLRSATRRTNQYNQGRCKANTSGYKGVHLSNWKTSWVAQIKVKGKIIYLGSYKTPEEAYKAYCEGAVKYHGEFARF